MRNLSKGRERYPAEFRRQVVAEARRLRRAGARDYGAKVAKQFGLDRGTVYYLAKAAEAGRTPKRSREASTKALAKKVDETNAALVAMNVNEEPAPGLTRDGKHLLREALSQLRSEGFVLSGLTVSPDGLFCRVTYQLVEEFEL